MRKLTKNISLIATMVFILFAVNSCTKDSVEPNDNNTAIHKSDPEQYPFVLSEDMQPYQYAVYEDDFSVLFDYMQSVFDAYQDGDERGYFTLSYNAIGGLIHYGFISETSIYYQPDNFIYPIDPIDPFVYPEEDDDNGNMCYGRIRTKNEDRLDRWAARQVAHGRTDIDIWEDDNGVWHGRSKKPKDWNDPWQ